MRIVLLIFFIVATVGCGSSSTDVERKGDAAVAASQFEDANSHYSKAIESEGGASRLYEKRAKVRMKLEEFKNAESDFTKAIELSKASPQLLMDRAKARYRIAQYEAAIADLDQILVLDNKNETAYFLRAQNRLELMQYVGAMSDINVVLKDKADYAPYLLLRGRIHLANKDLKKAESDFTSVIVKDPGNARAFWNRAMVYDQQGESELAKSDRDQAGQLDESLIVSSGRTIDDLKGRASSLKPIQVDVTKQ